MTTMRPTYTVALMVAALLVAGCGAGTKESAPRPAPSTNTPASFVEGADCRTASKHAMQLVDAAASDLIGSSGMDYDTFQIRYHRLQKLSRDMDATCTEAVRKPLSKMMYQLALANAMWTICTNADNCTNRSLRPVDRHFESALKAAVRTEDATAARE